MGRRIIIFLFFIFFSSIKLSFGICDNGWIPMENMCFKIFPFATSSVEEARRICTSVGAELGTMHSEEFRKILLQISEEEGEWGSMDEQKGFAWVGLSKKKGGDWVWKKFLKEESETLMDKRQFAKGNSKAFEEIQGIRNCAVFDPSVFALDGLRGAFKSIQCNALNGYFVQNIICEKDISFTISFTNIS